MEVLWCDILISSGMLSKVNEKMVSERLNFSCTMILVFIRFWVWIFFAVGVVVGLVWRCCFLFWSCS